MTMLATGTDSASTTDAVSDTATESRSRPRRSLEQFAVVPAVVFDHDALSSLDVRIWSRLDLLAGMYGRAHIRTDTLADELWALVYSRKTVERSIAKLCQALCACGEPLLRRQATKAVTRTEVHNCAREQLKAARRRDAQQPVTAEPLPYAMVPKSLLLDDSMPHTAVRVFCVLDRRAGSKSVTYQAISALAIDLRTSPRSLVTHLQNLDRGGYIERTRTKAYTKTKVLNPARGLEPKDSVLRECEESGETTNGVRRRKRIAREATRTVARQAPFKARAMERPGASQPPTPRLTGVLLQQDTDPATVPKPQRPKTKPKPKAQQTKPKPKTKTKPKVDPFSDDDECVHGEPRGEKYCAICRRQMERYEREARERKAVRAVAGNPSTPVDLLRTLATHEDPFVPMLVAGNPSTPVETLRELATHDGGHERRAVAENPSTPVDLLRTLATDQDSRVRMAVARANASQPEPDMDMLMLFLADRLEVRLEQDRAIAANKDAPEDVLKELATHEDGAVRRAAAENLKQREEQLRVAYELEMERWMQTPEYQQIHQEWLDSQQGAALAGTAVR